MEKMKVISGKHKGKIVEVVGVFWFCKTVLAKFEDGSEYAFKFNEVKSVI